MIDDPELYALVKQYADLVYSKPSAYKSGYIVRLYRALGGTYSGAKPKSGLASWFREQWVDVGNNDYPVYRPSKKINKKTPLLASEIDPQNLKEQVALKQKIKGTKNLPKFRKKSIQ